MQFIHKDKINRALRTVFCLLSEICFTLRYLYLVQRASFAAQLSLFCNCQCFYCGADANVRHLQHSCHCFATVSAFAYCIEHSIELIAGAVVE
ncbi:hypothetical protein T09_8080 [Trichinella sp. T9]|nr:hypothetical protein T09_15350 [Trichinella sp. T9]KRX45397.1 hypothetical protein T09_2411 [Trichinella sp. T9]KRX51851.1 hypothetical protein T09_8080 [Trichinella sp. T9]